MVRIVSNSALAFGMLITDTWEKLRLITATGQSPSHRKLTQVAHCKHYIYFCFSWV